MSKTIGVVLSMNDKMSPKLFKVSKNVKYMSKDMQRASKKATKMGNDFANSTSKMVGKAAKAGTALGALASAAIIKVGFDGLKELDEGAAKVKSIAKDALKIEDIKKGLLKTSNITGIDASELSEVQYNAISSGIKPDDSLDAAVTAANLSKAGFTDAESALKILTSTMNVYGLTGEKAMQSVSDKLLVTQNLGVTTVAELADSMGSLTPIANNAGASIDEMMAGMASLTKNGLKTDEAVTSLKGIMTSVIKPTSEAQKAAKNLGIDFSVGAVKSKGFAKFLEEVKEKTGGDTEAMGKLFGNVRALSGALILSGKGFNDFNGSLDAMKNSTGATDEALKIMQNTVGFKLGKLKNIAKNTATSIMESQSGAIGEAIDKLGIWVEKNDGKIQQWAQNVGKALKKIVDAIKKVFQFIKKHQDAIIFIGTFVVALVGIITVVKKIIGIVKVFKVVAAAVKGVMAISTFGIVGIAIAALIAIGVLLIKNWDKIKAKAIEIKDSVAEKFNGIRESVAGAFDSIKAKAGELWGKVAGVFDNIREKVASVVDAIKEKVDSIKTKFSEVWESIKTSFENFKTSITDKFTSFVDGIKEKWEGLKEFLKHPIKGVVNLFQNNNSGSSEVDPHQALGTSYWRGGLTHINERGGEIVDLPNGSRVIPADKSARLLNNNHANTTIFNIYGVGKTPDEIMNELTPKIQLALANS